MSDEKPTDETLNLEQTALAEIIGAPDPESYQLLELEFGNDPDLTSPEILTVRGYTQEAYERALAALPPVEVPQPNLEQASVKKWFPWDQATRKGGYGFITVRDPSSSQNREVFLHYSDVKTDVGDGDPQETDLTHTTLYYSQAAVVPGNRPGQYKLEKALTKGAYNRLLEKVRADASQQRSYAEKALTEKRQRAENMDVLVEHWAAIKAAAEELYRVDPAKFLGEEAQLSVDQAKEPVTVYVYKESGSATIQEFDGKEGLTREIKPQLKVEVYSRTRPRSTAAAVRLDVRQVEKGWRGVQVDGSSTNYGILDQENGAMQVYFNGPRVPHQGSLNGPSWVYPAKGEAPTTSTFGYKISQKVKAHTPVGDAERHVDLYSATEDIEQEPWDGFDIGEQRKEITRAYLEKNGVDSAIIEDLNSGELDRQIENVKTLDEATKLFNRLHAGSGKIWNTHYSGVENPQQQLREAFELALRLPDLLSPDVDVSLEERVSANGFTATTRDYDTGKLIGGDPIYAWRGWLELQGREPGMDSITIDIDPADKDVFKAKGLFNHTQTGERVVSKYYLEERSQLVETLMDYRISRVLNKKDKLEKLSIGPVRRALLDREVVLLEKAQALFIAEYDLSDEQRKLIEAREQDKMEIEAGMEATRQRFNDLLKAGSKYVDSEYRTYDSLGTTNEATTDLLPLINTVKADIERFREYTEGQLTFEEFRARHKRVEGPVDDVGLTTLERQFQTAEALVKKYIEMENNGYLVNHIIRPNRDRGSTEYIEDLILADGTTQEPDFTESRVRFQKDPSARRYDEVAPDTARVSYIIGNHGGQEPGNSVFIKVELNAQQLTDAQLDAVVDKLYSQGNTNWLERGNFTREVVLAQLARVAKKEAAAGEFLRLELSGRFFEKNGKTTYSATVDSYPRLTQSSSADSYEQRDRIAPFKKSDATRQTGYANESSSSDTEGVENPDNYPTQQKFTNNMKFVAEQTEEELLKQIRSPEGRYKGDVTLVEAAIARLGETHDYTQLLQDGLATDTLSRGVKRLETLLKQGRETSPFQADLQQAHTTLERKVIGMNMLYGADTLIRDYVGDDVESYGKVLTTLAQRMSEYEKENNSDLSGFDITVNAEEILSELT